MSGEEGSHQASRVRELFFEAYELADGGEREKFLNRACGDDLRLREEIDTLFKAHKESNVLLDKDFLAEFDQAFENLIGTVIGHYKVLEKLGEGGFGEVLRVEQVEPIHRELALKVIKPGMDSREIINRFESERQALALLDHPNIAHIVDAGATESGRPYFVMELACGLPITLYCDEYGLSIDKRLKLFQQVCQGVHHAHQKGIIHRDLNPSNIIIVEKEGECIPKIIDFGIAKSLQQQLTGKTILTQREVFVGTPDYMSPEQFAQSSWELDHRTDIYSLGCVLYELVSGTPPFDKDRMRQAGLSEIHRIIIEEEPEKPSTRIHTTKDTRSFAESRASTFAKCERKLRGDLDRIIMKSLEKDRTNRYDSAVELEQDIEAFLDSRPVKATSPGLLYRSWKLVRRTKQALLGWAAAMVFLIGFLAVLSTSFSGDSIITESTKYDKSIAILPLIDQRQDDGLQFFANGVHEGLIKRISRIPGLKVIAETSVRDYRDTHKSLATIADELGVALLLKGGIRQVADSVQIHVQLIGASDNNNIWADSYARKLSAENLFKIQNEISDEVARALDMVLSNGNEEPAKRFPTNSLKALEAYYRGLECLRDNSTLSTRAAIAHFETAISIDEGFALAHTKLGSGIARLSNMSGTPFEEVEEEVEACLNRALELDDTSSTSYLILGSLRIRQGDFVAAEDAINKATQLDPNSPNVYVNKAWLLQQTAGWESYNNPSSQITLLYKKALELDPKNEGAPYWRSRILIANGQFEEALELRRSQVSNRPNDFGALLLLGAMLGADFINQIDEAIVCLRKAHSMDPLYVDVMRKLCNHYLELGDPETAKFWMDRYIRVQNKELPRALMMVQKAYSSGNAEERIKHALLGLKEYPHSRGLLWHAAEVDIMNGQEDQAKFRWEQAYHKLFKSDVEVDNKLIWQAKYIARVLLRTGETKQAKHLIDECWKCYKERFPYGEPLLEAGLHLLDGNEESALESLGRYVETGGSSFALRHQTEFDVIRQRKEFQALLAQADARMALQLNLLREMEANGELAPIPELPEKLEPDEAPAQLQMQEMQYEGSQ